MVFKELYDYREMVRSLVKRDLMGRYKNSALGFLWNFLDPLLQLLIYTMVFTIIIPMGIDQYYLFVFVALVPWIFFSSAVTGGSMVIINQQDMVKKIYFPREVLVIAVTTSQMVNFLISYLIAFIVILVTGAGVNFQLLIMYLQLIMIIEYIMTLGISLVLAAIDVYFRDMEYITGVITMIWIWLTPIMYALDNVSPKLAMILGLNPMTHVIRTYQNILYYKVAPTYKALGILAIFAFVILIIGEFVFMRLEKHFAEEL